MGGWYLDADHRNTNNWPGYMTGYRRRTRHLNPTDYHLDPPDVGGRSSSR